MGIVTLGQDSSLLSSKNNKFPTFKMISNLIFRLDSNPENVNLNEKFSIFRLS